MNGYTEEKVWIRENIKQREDKMEKTIIAVLERDGWGS